MAEPTPVELYQSFCEEAALLTASIAGLEASPALDTLDDLSAAKTRLALVRDAIPGLCATAERFEQAERIAAIVAIQAPRWATSSTEKTDALATMYTLLGQLNTAMTAYANAHGAQTACLRSLPHYSATYRANYDPMIARLSQIVSVITGGDGSWMANLAGFDSIGKVSTLPDEY